MKKRFILPIVLLLNLFTALAQEESNDMEVEKKHSLAFVFSYTHIPEAREDGSVENVVFVPTIGLDYFYQFSEKWLLGAVFDLELSEYEVDFEEEEISRETALILGVVVGYEILPAWAIMIGPGIEFEKNKNLLVLRISTEYGFELGNNWELIPNFTYDFKQEYGSYALGVGIKKRF